MQATLQRATVKQSALDPQITRPLRWFFLIWEGLVYLSAVLSFYGVNPITLQRMQRPQQQSMLFLSHAGKSPFDMLGIVLFTILILIHGGLLWVSLLGKFPRSRTWFYFCAQGGLVYVISLLVQQDNVVLNLYLTLILGAIVLLQQTRFVVVVAVGYVLLFLVSNQNWETQIWNFNVLWDKTNYAATLLAVVGFVIVYMQQVRVQRQLSQANKQLQASADRIEELTLVTERQRLARELHDTLAQGVAGLIMQLEAANAQLKQQRLQVVEDILYQAMMSARNTLANARSVIDDLRIMNSREEFMEALDEEIRHFTVATGIVCETDPWALNQVPATLYEHVFLAVREGLHNIAKHARAHVARVSIVLEGVTLVVEVQDDGIGFELENATRLSRHYGLIGLRERARLVGGTLDVNSVPGAGTALRLRLPCNGEGEIPWALPSVS